MERNSIWRTPHALRTSICVCGSGEISSAKALIGIMAGPRKRSVKVPNILWRRASKSHAPAPDEDGGDAPRKRHSLERAPAAERLQIFTPNAGRPLEVEDGQ